MSREVGYPERYRAWAVSVWLVWPRPNSRSVLCTGRRTGHGADIGMRENPSRLPGCGPCPGSTGLSNRRGSRGTMDNRPTASISGEIRRSRLINWYAAVACCGIALSAPELLSWSNTEAAMLSLVLSGLLLEMIWRSGLRPRIVWDAYQLHILYPFRRRRFAWDEIVRIDEDSNRISIEAMTGTTVWEFDHAWLAAKLSKRYAARAGRNRERLIAAWAARRTDDSGSPRSVPSPRRPLLLFCVMAAATATLSYILY